MSTSAQPLGTHPPMLNHRDVLLNRSLSQLSPQENHLEYHLKPDSTESIRQESTHHNNSVQSLTHTHHMGTFTPHKGTHRFISIQRGTTHPSHGLSHMSTQLGLRGKRVLEDVSRSCNHQHSLSAREALSTRPSLSRKYSNFVLASRLVKISAIYSCVGRYCTCTTFLCTMSLI
jgi:hypothetical protein